MSEPGEKKGMPQWVPLVIVLGVIATLSLVAYYWAKDWGHKTHIRNVRTPLAEAKRLGVEGKDIVGAVSALKKAREKLVLVDSTSLDYNRLQDEIDDVKTTIRKAAGKKLHQMIADGKELEAKKFYDDQVRFVDTPGASNLKTMVDEAIAAREAKLGLNETMTRAKKHNKNGEYAEALLAVNQALKTISSLRKIGPAIDRIRTEGRKIEKQWILDTETRGMAFFSEGDLAQAMGSLRVGIEAADRDMAYDQVGRRLALRAGRLQARHVVGVVVNVKSVRGEKPETIKEKFLREVEKKLDKENYLLLPLKSQDDEKGKQLLKQLVIDYAETKGPQIKNSSGDTANATRITCSLRLILVRTKKVTWRDNVNLVNLSLSGIGEGKLTDAALRDSITRLFWGDFKVVTVDLD